MTLKNQHRTDFKLQEPMRSQAQGPEEVELQAKQVRVTRLPLGETGEGTGNRINSLAVELMEENT